MSATILSDICGHGRSTSPTTKVIYKKIKQRVVCLDKALSRA